MAIALTTGVVTASATCWRINPSPYAGAQFKTVADAMNDINVLPGDTLLLDPGSHGNVDVRNRKNLTVIGSGYFIDKNKDWAESRATIISYAYLSEGSKIEGCDATYISLTDDCTATRCKADQIAAAGSGTSLITQCYVNGLELSDNDIVRNNIILSHIFGTNGCTFDNNTIVSSGVYYNEYYIIFGFKNSTIRNNVIINTKQGFDSNQIPYITNLIHSGCSNNVIQNNILSTPEKYANSSYPQNHFVGATIENTFVNEGSDDAKWQLLDSSAAKGAATHGGDCGAFGGPTPYVLSGIPQFLPHITEALVPAKPTDGKITVKLKIANQNE